MSRAIAFLYDNYDDAIKTVRDLEAANIAHDDVSFVANNANDRYSTPGVVEEGRASHGAGTGATIGAAMGGGAGLLAGLGMLAIPGIGPVVAAGWLAATLAGAVAGAGVGAATGGIVDAMTSAGVSKEDAHIYAESVRRGSTLVVARADEGKIDVVTAIMQRHNPVDSSARRSEYRREGWQAFDPAAEPFSISDRGRL